MLYLNVTKEIPKNVIWDIDVYFDYAYKPEWIWNDFAKRMIEDVDKSHVVAPRIIDSPYLGYVDPTHISGGVKCVLCLAFDPTTKWKFNITVCGDNCMRWIQLLSEFKDIRVDVTHLPKFDDDVYFNIVVENVNKLCTCYEDILDAWAEVDRLEWETHTES